MFGAQLYTVLCIYLLTLQVERAKVLSNTVKQKRKEKAGKWEVPLPKVMMQYNDAIRWLLDHVLL